MDNDARDLIQAIHDAPLRVVLTTAGAGTEALAWLLGVAGASRTLIEALVPYDSTSFDDFLGQTPEQYVAAETARRMAGRAYTRGQWLRPDLTDVAGLACTATIVTDRPKRGEHRAHIASWQPTCVIHYRLGLEKGGRDRAGEEDVVSRLLLNALAEAAGLQQRLTLTQLAGDTLQIERYDLAQVARRLDSGELDWFGVTVSGEICTAEATPGAILSGAFNPLHEGHLALARAAAAFLEREVAFELAAVNVDKPPLSSEVILRRIAQFAGRWPVYVSRAPTYVAKARLYPGTIFVVGIDTAVRVVEPRYYGDDTAAMRDALAEIRRQGCRFLVAGRTDDEGHFHDPTDFTPAAEFADLFQPLPGFRRDISSTELRESGRRGSR